MTTPTTVQVKIQLRRDTAATWASVNPVLLAGEAGLETDTNKIKIGNGSTAWNSLGYFPFVVNGGTVTGNLEIGTTGTLTFEGSSADNFETTLGVVNPTADRTINLPNVSGTIITTGDTGTVTSTMLADGTIVDADVSATAEIAVSKLADGAARQLLQTDAAGTGVEWTSNIDIPGTLDVTGAATFDAAVTVTGDLTVNGTTTTISTQNLLVEDKNIIIGDVATPTDTTADGGGITLKGATDKTINWVDATDAWTSSERFSVPLGSAAAPSLTITGDANSGLYSPGADQVAISTGGSGRLFVDASGRVLINGATARTNILTTSTVGFQLEGTSFDTSNIVSIRNSSDTGSANLILGKTRGSTVGSTTIVQSGDQLGVIRFTGSDGTTFLAGSTIQSYADGTMGAGVMPGYLVFSTTPTGAGGPSERLRITSAGLVGIGTISPGSQLDIVAQDNIRGTGFQPFWTLRDSNDSNKGIRLQTAGGAGLFYTDSVGNGTWVERLRITSTGTLNFVGAGTAGSTQAVSFNGSAPINSLVIDSSGRIGVGSSSPGTYLDTRGFASYRGNAFAIASFAANNTLAPLNICQSENGTHPAISAGQNSSGVYGPLILMTSELKRVLIDSSGNVGIGTASPQARTHISATTSDTTAANYNQGQLIISDSDAENSGLVVGYRYQAGVVEYGRIQSVSNGTATNLILQGAGGNVGIGATSPSGLLHLQGASIAESWYTATNAGGATWRVGTADTSSGLSGAYRIYDATNSAARLLITSTGNVGIGTTSPGALLHLRSAAARMFCENSSTGETAEFGVDATGALIQAGGAKSTVFYTNGFERARIDSSGRLLVGTPSSITTLSDSPRTQVFVNDQTGASFIRGSANEFGSNIHIVKSRSASSGSRTIVQSGDELGSIFFGGDDGSTLNSIAARITAEVDGTPGANSIPGRIVLSTTAAGASSPTPRMRISANGNTFTFATATEGVSIANTSGAGTTVAHIAARHSATGINTGTASFVVWTNGNVVNTNNSYGAISDVKLKENIADANSQWDDLKALQVRNYNFKEGQTHTQIGLVAQEAELVSPGLVSESPDRDEDGNDLGTVTKSVNYSVLYMKAVKALQEAMERIEQLEQRLTDAGIA